MKPPYKIALVTTELAVGGAEKCLVNLACRLDRQHFQPEVYALASPPDDGQQQLVEQLEQAEIPTHFLGMNRTSKLLRARNSLATRLVTQGPAILQSFLFHANVVGGMAHRHAGVPLHVTGIRVADPRKWRYPVERWATRTCQKVVCVSEAVAEFSRTTAGISAEKIEIIPNGIDVDRPTKAQSLVLESVGLPKGREFLLFVGRLDVQKGIDVMLPWLTPFLQRHNELDLLMLGEGPLRDQLEKQVESLGLTGRVHLPGWQEDVAAFYPAARCLVLPSRWEGMPNALIEAMAAGLPVVASDVEGVKEVLGESQEQLFDPENGDQFVAKLSPVVDDRQLAARLGKANQQRIENHFSLDKMVASYQQLYTDLIRRIP